ncbi:MAG: Calx-beta domain-containing protein [Chloroflexota bacterium]
MHLPNVIHNMQPRLCLHTGFSQKITKWQLVAIFFLVPLLILLASAKVSAVEIIDAEFLVNTNLGSVQKTPDVAKNATGDFVVVWEHADEAIRFQRYNHYGATQGSEETIFSAGGNLVSDPAMAMDANGNFAIVWTYDSGDTDIYLQLFATTTVTISDLIMPADYVGAASVADQLADVAVNDNGNMVVAWQKDTGSNAQIVAQRYTYSTAGILETGALIELDDIVGQEETTPAVALDASGNFAITYKATLPSADHAILTKRYQSSGTLQPTNGTITHTLTNSSGAIPDVAMSDSGDFVVVWNDTLPVSGDSDIYAQRYDSDGNQSGSEITINITNTVDDVSPRIDMQSTGGFVVAWEVDTSDEIHVQAYDASNNATTGRFQANTNVHTVNDPAVAIDESGDFVAVWGGKRSGVDSGGGIFASFYASPRFSLSKSMTPVAATINGGSVVTYTLQASNSGALTTTDVVIKDTTIVSAFSDSGLTLAGEITVSPASAGIVGSASTLPTVTHAITLGPNESVQISFPVTVGTFFVDESNITNTASGSGTNGASASTSQTFVVSITQPTISLSHTAITVTEANATVTLDISLSKLYAADITLDYATSDTTTTASSDYIPSSGTATIPSGSLSTAIVVTITDDIELESTETLRLVLTKTAASHGHLTETSSLIHIVDEDYLTLSVDKTVEPVGPVGAGDRLTYAVRVTNSGNISAFNLTISDTLPTGVNTAISSLITQSNMTPATSASSLSLHNGQLTYFAVAVAPDEQITLTIPVTVNTSGLTDGMNLINRVSVTSTQHLTPVTALVTNTVQLPTITIDSVSVDESSEQVSLTITLSETSAANVSVGYTTVNKTAVAGHDYDARSGTAVIPSGSLSTTVAITITNDISVEAAETFTVSLSNANNGMLSSVISETRGLVTIHDNDYVTFSMTKAVMPTGGIRPGTRFTYTLWVTNTGNAPASNIVLSDTLPSPITANQADIHVDTVSEYMGSLTGSLYTLSVGGLATNGVMTVTIPVTLNATGLVHGMTLVNMASVTSTEVPTRTTASVTNTVAQPLISISNISVNEDAGTATLIVALAESGVADAGVTYTTVDQTATAGTDYIARSETLTIAAGSLSATVVIAIQDDALQESTETLVVELSNPVNARLADTLVDRQGQVSILDNETIPMVSIQDASASENNGTIDFLVTLSEASGQAVHVSYQTEGATASGNGYYVPQNTTLTIASGQTSGVIAIPIVDQPELLQGERFFYLNLTGATNATIVDAQAKGTIIDLTTPTPTNTPTETQTSTPSSTPTQTPTSSVTPTPTSTSTGTMPTPTATPTLPPIQPSTTTATPVNIPVNTPVSIATPVPLAQVEATSTATPEPTVELAVDLLFITQLLEITEARAETADSISDMPPEQTTYQVLLASEPAASVTVLLTTDEQLQASPTALVFDATNWQTPQSVTITAVDDDLMEGSHTGTVVHTVMSTDSGFTQLNPTSLAVNILDDELLEICPGNVSWVTACARDLTSGGSNNGESIRAAARTETVTGFTVKQHLNQTDQTRWYKFSVEPESKLIIELRDLTTNYDITLYKDIWETHQSLQDIEDSEDLALLGAEFAPDAFSPDAFSPDAFSPDAFSPDAFSPDAFSPDAFSPDAFSPDAFSPDAFSPDAFSPDAFSPDAFSPDAFSPDAFSPDAFSPDAFSPDAFSPDAFSPDAFSPDAFSPDAFSSAQTRSLLAVSAFNGTASERIVVNTWDNAGDYYVRVRGRNGAQLSESFYTLEVTHIAGLCSGVSTLLPETNTAVQAGAFKTLVLVDYSRLTGSPDELAAMQTALQEFVQRPEVMGVVVDVSQDARVAAANAQADAAPLCPFAKNLVAYAIKDIVTAYRAHHDIGYVVLLGNDEVIPFFRHPDQAGLANERNYIPPVFDNTASQASLKRGYVLSQDNYGAAQEISIHDDDFPIFDLPVGRLVETPDEIRLMLDAYLLTENGVVAAPQSAMVTGYDFLEDVALSVKDELEAGIGVAADALIVSRDLPPTHPDAWTGPQVEDMLNARRHDIIFLAGHFSAGSALAADYSTRLLASSVAESEIDLLNALVYSAGCHSGYNIVNAHAVPGISADPDWAQAFARKQATFIGGTGYQYGDTDFIEYSERLYLEFTKHLRYTENGAGEPVAIGDALVAAKQQYLADIAQMRPLHEKSLLEATIFGLPMLKIDLPTGRIVPESETSLVADSPTSRSGNAAALVPLTHGPGAVLGTQIADVSVAPETTQETIVLHDPASNATADAVYLTGKNGVVSHLAEPVMPFARYNVGLGGSSENSRSSSGSLMLRGVGLRSAMYTDINDVFMLTGATATEIRGVHSIFTSDVFYPMLPWRINHFNAVMSGASQTRLSVLPAQYRSNTVTDQATDRSIGTLRQWNQLGFRLYYSDNVQQYINPNTGEAITPALADPPTIAHVLAESVQDGEGGANSTTQVAFSARVVGHPAAGIQEVWVTYTSAGQDSYHGQWQSLDLTQSQQDSTQWTGVLTLPAEVNPEAIRYIVQAANGVGLVTVNTNWGAYHQPNVDPSVIIQPDIIQGASQAAPHATTLTLLSDAGNGSLSGAFGETVTIQAQLTTLDPEAQNSGFSGAITMGSDAGQTIADQSVTLYFGEQRVHANTDQHGVATFEFPLLSSPGTDELQVVFDGGVLNAGVPDAGVPDAGVPDAGVPDAGVPDAGVPDAGVLGSEQTILLEPTSHESVFVTHPRQTQLSLSTVLEMVQFDEILIGLSEATPLSEILGNVGDFVVTLTDRNGSALNQQTVFFVITPVENTRADSHAFHVPVITDFAGRATLPLDYLLYNLALRGLLAAGDYQIDAFFSSRLTLTDESGNTLVMDLRDDRYTEATASGVLRLLQTPTALDEVVEPGQQGNRLYLPIVSR